MKFLISMLLIAVLFSFGCSHVPNSFKESNESWIDLPVSSDLTDEQAWNNLTDIISRRFDLEMISKDGYYIRTNWKSGFNNTDENKYRVQVIAKYSPVNHKVSLKVIANYKKRSEWINGTDIFLIETLKKDLSGVLFNN